MFMLELIYFSKLTQAHRITKSENFKDDLISSDINNDTKVKTILLGKWTKPLLFNYHYHPPSPLPPYGHGLLFDEKNSSPNDLSFWKLRSLNTMKCLLLYPQFLILLTFPLNISHNMKNIYHLHHIGYKESKYFNKFVKYIFFWSTLVIDMLKCTLKVWFLKCLKMKWISN